MLPPKSPEAGDFGAPIREYWLYLFWSINERKTIVRSAKFPIRRDLGVNKQKLNF